MAVMRINAQPAVVELVALDNAEIKFSTIQNWYLQESKEKEKVESTNFVTKTRIVRKPNAKFLGRR